MKEPQLHFSFFPDDWLGRFIEQEKVKVPSIEVEK